MEKQRQNFICEDEQGFILAFGVLYREGNVQIYWRHSLGWTMEQHHSIANVLYIEQGIRTLRFDDSPLPTEDIMRYYELPSKYYDQLPAEYYEEQWDSNKIKSKGYTYKWLNR